MVSNKLSAVASRSARSGEMEYAQPGRGTAQALYNYDSRKDYRARRCCNRLHEISARYDSEVGAWYIRSARNRRLRHERYAAVVAAPFRGRCRVDHYLHAPSTSAPRPYQTPGCERGDGRAIFQWPRCYCATTTLIFKPRRRPGIFTTKTTKITKIF